MRSVFIYPQMCLRNLFTLVQWWLLLLVLVANHCTSVKRLCLYSSKGSKYSYGLWTPGRLRKKLAFSHCPWRWLWRREVKARAVGWNTLEWWIFLKDHWQMYGKSSLIDVGRYAHPIFNQFSQRDLLSARSRLTLETYQSPGVRRIFVVTIHTY